MIDGKGPYPRPGQTITAKQANDLQRRVERLERIKSKSLLIQKTGDSISIERKDAEGRSRFQVDAPNTEVLSGPVYPIFRVGYGRDNTIGIYPFYPDTIWVWNYETDAIAAVSFDTPEEITLDPSPEDFRDGVLYYEMTRDEAELAETWDAVLTLDYALADGSFENFESFSTGKLHVLVATFRWESGDGRITYLHQELTDNPILHYYGGGVSKHPFKARMKSASTLEVGYLRPEIKDSINIVDPDTDALKVLAYSTPQELVLDTVSYYIYYSLHKTTGGWVSTLKKSPVWPPIDGDPAPDDDGVGNIILQVGYSNYDAGYIWYQHLYDCPTMQPACIRGDFEPWYSDNGSVTIAAGTVDNFNNDLTTVAQKSFLLSAAVDIWVTITSVPSGGAPDVTVNPVLQSGVYPGLFFVSGASRVFNYKIGEITSGGIYQPKHKGCLDLDITLLQPLIVDAYTATLNEPRMLLVHDDQVSAVGDVLLDVLLDLKRVNVEVRGGGIQEMEEGGTIKIYGLTTDDAALELVETTGVDGTDFGEGSISLTPKNITYDFARGLLQELEFPTGTRASITAGDNIQITYAAGVAEIHGVDAVLYEALLWLEIQNQNQVVHVESPVISEADVNHWAKCKWDLTAGNITIDGGAPQTEVTLYWDKANHMYSLDGLLSDGPVTTNWLYRHCSNQVSFPDLIYAAQQANLVILVADECYEEIGQTQKAVTGSVAPTATYTVCADCTASVVNKKWKRCDTDADAAVFIPATAPTEDFAWICISSIYVKCYFSANTADAATAPVPAWVNAPLTVTACLDEWAEQFPTNDDYGGVGDNSGAVDDANWLKRYTNFFAGQTVTISSGRLKFVTDGTFTAAYILSAHTGDHTTIVDYQQVAGGTNNVIQVHCNSPDLLIEVSEGLARTGYKAGAAGWVYNSVPWNAAYVNGKMKFVRVGATVTGYLWNGATWDTIGSGASSNPASLYMSTGNAAATVYFDNVDMRDGSSNIIQLLSGDITGDAC